MKFFDNGYHAWRQPQTLPPKSFLCGYCGRQVSSEKGMKIGEYNDASGKQVGGMYICPSCNGPVFFSLNDEQFPQAILGSSVSNVPIELNALYEEARKCTGQGCYTACVLTCRKMLMNIAVEQGAKEGLRFIEYVNFLADSGFIPPNGKHWVDHIRKRGNEATHEIQLMTEQDAKELLVFLEMLLKFIYEFPNMVSVDSI